MRWNHDKNRNILAVAGLQSQLVFDSAQVHVLKKKDLVSDLSWVSSDTRREFSYLAGQPLDLTSIPDPPHGVWRVTPGCKAF